MREAYPNELCHYGIKGQKWGVRRFENSDGTLTPAGKSRYSQRQQKEDERLYGKRAAKRIRKRVDSGDEGVKSARHVEVERKESKEKRKRKIKKVAKLASIPVSAAVAAFAYPKVYDKTTSVLNNLSNKNRMGSVGSSKEQKKYDKAYKKNFTKAYNTAANRTNEDLDRINAKYEKKMSKYSSWDSSPLYKKYEQEVNESFNKHFNKAMEELIGKRPE